jgi:hypothetical protein
MGRSSTENIMHYSSAFGNRPAHIYEEPVVLPQICDEISVFESSFKMLPGFTNQTDYYEIRRVKELKTKVIKMVKIYRKREFATQWTKVIK